jgi:hypothetical protein
MLAHFIVSQEIQYLFVATTWKKEKYCAFLSGNGLHIVLLHQCSALIDFQECKLEPFLDLTFNFFKN